MKKFATICFIITVCLPLLIIAIPIEVLNLITLHKFKPQLLTTMRAISVYWTRLFNQDLAEALSENWAKN